MQLVRSTNRWLKRADGIGGRMVAEIVKGLPVGRDEPAAHPELRKLLGD